MVYLGIDYGRAKVGLAIAEDSLARPLEVLTNNKNLIKKIAELCQAEQVEEIIIGLPEGKLKQAVISFSLKLAKGTNLPVEFQSESLTTHEAIAKMIEAGKGKKARKEREDAFAAALILQNYLNQNV